MPVNRRSTHCSESLKSKDVCCGSEVIPIRVPTEHQKSRCFKVHEKLPHQHKKCKDQHECVRLKPIKVGAKDLKIKVEQEDQHIGPDRIDVFLERSKSDKFSGPDVYVDVEPPHVEFERQKVDVYIKKGKHCREEPVVKVHVPPPKCHVGEAKVHVRCKEGCREYCAPKPKICYHWEEDKCEKKCEKRSTKRDLVK